MNIFLIYKTVLLFAALRYKTLLPCECDTKVTGVNLVVHKQELTDDYLYTKSGKHHIFTTKDNKKFKSVKHFKKLVWYTDYETQYATKVEFVEYGYRDMLEIIIHCGTNTKHFYKVESAQWELLDPNGKVAVDLNVGANFETCFWTVLKGSTVCTFTAKKGFVFDKVVEAFGKNSVEIWKSATAGEHSIKVERNSFYKRLSVFLGAGESAITKVFKKGTDNKWVEDKSVRTTPSPKPASSDSTTSSGSVLASGCKKRSAIILDINGTSGNQYTINKGSKSTSYTCYQGFMIEKVVAGPNILWQAQGSGCAKGLTVDKSSGSPKVTLVQLVGNESFV